MIHAFHPEAEAEFLEAIAYYEECRPGLSHDFAAEVQSTIQRILTFPKFWLVLEGDIRRALVHRFPYGVLDAPEEVRVWIVAVMHLHREPDYWRERVG